MRLLRVAGGLLVSLGLVWLFFRSTDPDVLQRSLVGANYAALGPALAVFFVGVWVRSVRWGLLLGPLAALPIGYLFRAMVIGFTVNNLMPIRLGEVARAMLLARWANVPPAATLGTIVVERLLDGLTLCGLLLLAWLWLPLEGWLRLVAVLGGFGFVVGLAFAAVAAFWPARLLAIAERAGGLLPAGPRQRGLRLANSFLDGFAALRRKRLVLPALGLSLAAWLCEATMYYLIMLGFDLQVGPLAALLGMAAANLGTMVPSSPGFVGTFDLPLQAVLTELFGVRPSLAASYTLVVHATLIVPVVVVGFVFLWREGLSFGEVSRRPSAPRPLGRSAGAATETL